MSSVREMLILHAYIVYIEIRTILTQKEVSDKTVYFYNWLVLVLLHGAYVGQKLISQAIFLL